MPELYANVSVCLCFVLEVMGRAVTSMQTRCHHFLVDEIGEKFSTGLPIR